jgi:hypothetical protein
MPVAAIAQQSQQQHVGHHDRYTVTDLGVLGKGTNSSGVTIADSGWKTIRLCIKGPCDHPMKPNWYSGTRLGSRIVVTPLCCYTKHVNHAGRFLRKEVRPLTVTALWFGLARQNSRCALIRKPSR